MKTKPARPTRTKPQTRKVRAVAQVSGKGRVKAAPKGRVKAAPKGRIKAAPKGRIKAAPKGRVKAVPRRPIKSLPKPVSKVAPKGRVKAIPKGRVKAPPAKPKTLPSRLLASTMAVKMFGQAVRQFYDHDFEKARRAFLDFIERFPEETDMVARARSYVAICNQRLQHPPSTPRNAEALYNRGVIELNLGHVVEAVSFFEKALKYEPQAAHILYSLAAAHARMGLIEQAVKELKQAVEQRDTLRIQARHDSDFTNLYTHPEFQELVGWELVPQPEPAQQPIPEN
ncbi:MAG: tetratricopeptide repeat protein [Blastocatellia bacterium]|nr:tetratricopeptide repeat protein [Blastocatellia bacterium]